MSSGVHGNAPRRAFRIVFGYGMVAAVLPYLVLKLMWLAGHMVGIPHGSPARGPEFLWPNLVTAVMDGLAILVAMAFTHRWGLRLPAWLVLAPAWIGTGFLGPAVVQVVNGGLAALVTGGTAVSTEGGLVAPWAYALVYASFAAQGVLLVGGLAGYANTRWRYAFQSAPRADDPVSVPRAGDPVCGALAVAGAAGAAVVAAGHLAMGLGGEGAYGAYQAGWEYTSRSGQVVDALAALLAAAGVLGLAWPPLARRIPRPHALVASFAGSGAMFAYALLTVTAVVTGLTSSAGITTLDRVVQLVALLTGLMIALTTLFTVARPAR